MTRESVLSFLNDVDKDFIPNISAKVNLEEFVCKVFSLSELIAVEDEEIKGLLVLYCNDAIENKAYISFVAVRNMYRRQGIARSLMASAIQRAKEKGMKAIGIHSNNPVALGLYKSLGFKTIIEGSREYLELDLK